MRQVRRPRPTFRTAHQYHQEGSFGTGPEHYVDRAELERFSSEMAESLLTLIKTQFPRSANLEYAILKAHLIVEFALTQYIRGKSQVLVDEIALKRFAFSHKLEIAYLMGFGVNDPIVIPSIERLNQVRNQVAHTFEIDRTAFDEMIRINSEDYEDFAEMTDRERVRRLRWMCVLITGLAAGELSAHHWSWPRGEEALRTDPGR